MPQHQQNLQIDSIDNLVRHQLAIRKLAPSSWCGAAPVAPGRCMALPGRGCPPVSRQASEPIPGRHEDDQAREQRPGAPRQLQAVQPPRLADTCEKQVDSWSVLPQRRKGRFALLRFENPKSCLCQNFSQRLTNEPLVLDHQNNRRLEFISPPCDKGKLCKSSKSESFLLCAHSYVPPVHT